MGDGDLQKEKVEKSEEPQPKPPDTTNCQTVLSYINSCDKLNLVSFIIVLISISTIIAIGVDECKRCFAQHPTVVQNVEPPQKTYWVYGNNIDSGYLSIVYDVMQRVGYKKDPNATNWDLLWAHKYPFRELKDKLIKLKPHQRVNKFPGSGYITEKVNLCTSGLKYVPRAFKLPQDKEKVLEFSKDNPDVEFVVKNNNHRNIRLRKLADVNLDSNETFVQEFIKNPLLVSGHMFDIGIYTIVTSIDPLRVYIYNGDYLLRFCPEKYYPFDPENLNKYVVNIPYLQTWKVPGLDYYFNHLGMGMRDSLFAYLEKEGKDFSVISEQIEDAINTVFLAKEAVIADLVKRFGSKDNFFEMMRFDFMVDENLKVYLMEANMSPNLSSGDKPNQLLYNQVLYNLLSIVGIAERVQKDSLAKRNLEEETMQSSEKNIAVMATECESKCKETCLPLECSLCKPCMSNEIRSMLLRAHREHLNIGDCKRIFPPPMVKKENLPANYATYTPSNQLMYRWFKEKCEMDSTWCN